MRNEHMDILYDHNHHYTYVHKYIQVKYIDLSNTMDDVHISCDYCDWIKTCKRKNKKLFYLVTYAGVYRIKNVYNPIREELLIPL